MSSKKPQPLRTLSQAPQTPRRKPSTPHGTRAQLHRSGGDRRRSGRIEKPWSAHGILRQLSRVEASKPPPKSRLSEVSLPQNTLEADKENSLATPSNLPTSDSLDDEEVKGDLPRPRLSLPLSSPDDEDSSIGPAPTPSILADGEGTSPQREGDDNFTLKSIEYGRRAMQERDRRFSRPSFGSIRMSDFRGVTDEDSGAGRSGKSPFGRESTDFGDSDIGNGIGDDEDINLADGNETEDFRLMQLRQSLSMPVHDDTLNTVSIDDQDEDTFRLHFNAAEKRKSLSLQRAVTASDGESEGDVEDADATSVALSPARLIHAAGAASPPQPMFTNEQTQSPSISTRRKKHKLSKHGLKLPSLPSSLIKRLGMDALTSLGRRKSRIGRDSLKALEQATEWFFEQVGEDLEAYSEHAGRKRRVVETDVLALMKRQRQISSMDAVPTLAREHLPKDVLKEIDLTAAL